MKKIILIGAGGHCTSCIDVIEMQKKFKVIGLIDNKKNFFTINYKIIGEDKELKKFSKKAQYALITTGQIKNSKIRESLFNKALNDGFKFPTIISPIAYVSKRASIGQGTIVMHGVVINSCVEIGSNCIINSNSLIEHGVKIGNHTHISTGAIINGDCKVGNNSFIGSGTIVKEGAKIGNRCVIGMGQIIKKDIKDNKKVY